MGLIVFVYGVFAYLSGVAALLYLILFVGNLWVPMTIDSVATGSPSQAVLVDLALIALFGLQHSVMARPSFKAWWTRGVPESIERSTYVLATALVTALLCWQWQPIAGTVWSVESPAARLLLQGLFWFGWVLLLLSTFMINHFDLFGLRQVYLRLKRRTYTPVPFVEMAVYKLIRHPIMLGLLLGLWSTPDMSYGHLLFAVGATIYIFIGIWFEERNTREALGAAYERYRRDTPMLLPLPRRKAT
ncbi:MAG: methanethiol S-methyltransferase [Mizugakiibacter sp.]|uniref:methanethiol S-methyltransferase n=1 Tax=Mizugakiibacter sp. TaxID=1972610 RepID=UPI0031BD01FD|nr:isoprenylcysteine carboxylmethyltransferase family protein [Xanthomonadaceae bacterium]